MDMVLDHALGSSFIAQSVVREQEVAGSISGLANTG